MPFSSLQEMVVASAEAVRPAERITVAEAAQYHIVKTAGQHAGPFSLVKTPYLVEPMETLTSLDYTAMVFAGPARTGKSAMFLNWLCHTAITDPADMMLVHMTQTTAREWSKGDLDKAIRNSPELRKRLVPGRQNDNVYDKMFLSGMRLSITWPTIDNLSGKTIPRLWIMDMDRIKPQVIDGEGHVFDLTKKRAGTFKRFGMTVAEASPGFPVKDFRWLPNADEPHEAPPCEGILSIYNRGDRRRWYWECLFCGDWFEPRFNLMRWPDSADFMESAEQAHIACPHCFNHNKNPLTFDMLPELNESGTWIKEGQRMVIDDGQAKLVGTPRRSDIASFWMFGPAAGLATDWKTLVLNYLRACDEYEKTGDEASLMTTTTVDQGEAYVPKTLEGARLPETLKNRAENWGGHDENGDPYIPAGARFLISAIDVQAGGRPSFVVHTFAIGENFDIWHVAMWKILKSDRRDPETDERLDLDPAAHPEDWDVIIAQVMDRTYPLPDGTGRRMAVKMTVCDSGGKAGVTKNAYDFYRRLRRDGKDARFHLLKGAPSKTDTSVIRVTYPDDGHKDKLSIARGDVPVWLINSNIAKDTAYNKMGREEPGGMVHFPDWSPDWLYKQLTNEVRDPAGGWVNPYDKRNEAFDLLAYCVAFCDHPDIKIRFFDWTNPPSWACPWDRNEFVVSGSERPYEVDYSSITTKSLADIARDVA